MKTTFAALLLMLGSGLLAGPSLIFDSRNNNTYTTKGAIITSYLNLMQGILGNNNYHGAFMNIEYAQFIPLAKRLVLGTDIQSQNLLIEIPENLLN